VKRELLEGALDRHVERLGFTAAAVHAAAEERGLSKAAVGLFPRGEAELIELFLRRSVDRLAAELAAREGFAELRVRDRIALGIRLRLEMTAPVLHVWPAALGVMLLPQNAPHALRSMRELTDAVWYAAGDTATDYNWYTKRAILAGVYSSAELYMLSDSSPGFEDTWRFVGRSLDGVLATFGRGKKALTEVADLLAKFRPGRAGAASDV